MGKAVLVMDMPSSCTECDFCEYQDEGWLWCNRRNKTARAFDKPDWCPLKPMPEKKVLSGDVADIQKMGKELLDIGYNACIDELLGEENG